MIQFRSFRNFDPPNLVSIWNECFTGRSSYSVTASAFLERSVFSKSYFDSAGLTVATEDNVPVGFGHAGFGADASFTRLDCAKGVICAIGVRNEKRRQGIGTGILQRLESYLRDRGAASIRAGGKPPCSPFYFGLYGGSDLPGVLNSDILGARFFLKHGYQLNGERHVYQRRLNSPINFADGRMLEYRKQFEITIQQRAGLDNWWLENSIGLIEPVEFRLENRATRVPVGRAVLWEMDGFSTRYGAPAAGVINIVIAPEQRRQGLAKFFLGHLLKHLQEQCFGICECQIDANDEVALRMLKSLGFINVDVGRSYVKSCQVTTGLSTGARSD